ncbi:MAG TPA: hypothetical protein DCZ75_18915 [Geobacter sp.]|nr:hypothetical protein [Geobacter sp.]
MFKRLGMLFCGVCAAALLSSCGDENLGAGVGEFTTVTASAVASTTRLESDVLTDNTCSAGVSTGGTFSTDTVDIDFTSTSLFPNALNLVVSRITIQYTPVNPATTPPLPDYFISTSQVVAPGSTVTIPVVVVPDNYKFALVSRSTQNLNVCSADYFEYYVNVLFTVSEPGGNGKSRDVPAKLNVAIADRS